jgi:hypothetical protein
MKYIRESQVSWGSQTLQNQLVSETFLQKCHACSRGMEGAFMASELDKVFSGYQPR